MTSLQQPAPGSKSAKFVATNPLDPIVRPFEGLVNDNGSHGMSSDMADKVQERFQHSLAVSQLPQSQGPPAVRDPPPKEDDEDEDAAHAAFLQRKLQQLDHDDDESSNFDDDDSAELNAMLADSLVMDSIRHKRLAQMKAEHDLQQHYQSLGHGELRTIRQDDVLPECQSTQSKYVALHFFHDTFQRCDLLDRHLQTLAKQYLECKFLRIHVDKAPFFVQKLQVRTLPTLLIFHEGKVIDRLVGFEGLAPRNAKNPDDFETFRLAHWMSKCGALTYKGPSPEELEELREKTASQNKNTTIRGGFFQSRLMGRHREEDDEY